MVKGLVLQQCVLKYKKIFMYLWLPVSITVHHFFSETLFKNFLYVCHTVICYTVYLIELSIQNFQVQIRLRHNFKV